MGRRKVRNYNNREFYRDLFNNYFTEHNDEVMIDLLQQTHFATVDMLADAERKSYFGLDCGWIVLRPKNEAMRHEWFLDDDRISANMFVHNPHFNCQSTTVQKIMVDKAVKDLGLEDTFYVSVRLD